MQVIGSVAWSHPSRRGGAGAVPVGAQRGGGGFADARAWGSCFCWPAKVLIPSLKALKVGWQPVTDLDTRARCGYPYLQRLWERAP